MIKTAFLDAAQVEVLKGPQPVYFGLNATFLSHDLSTVVILKCLITSGSTGPDQISCSERGNLQGNQFWPLAAHIYEQAREKGIGREIPTEWFLQDIRD
jgi:hypothetical protein